MASSITWPLLRGSPLAWGRRSHSHSQTSSRVKITTAQGWPQRGQVSRLASRPIPTPHQRGQSSRA